MGDWIPLVPNQWMVIPPNSPYWKAFRVSSWNKTSVRIYAFDFDNFIEIGYHDYTQDIFDPEPEWWVVNRGIKDDGNKFQRIEYFKTFFDALEYAEELIKANRNGTN